MSLSVTTWEIFHSILILGITKFHNQLMVIISNDTSTQQSSTSETMYQRIERIKNDVETIVKNNHHNHFQVSFLV